MWQSVGGLGWTVGPVLAGRYLLPVIAVVVSLIPLARELLRERRRAPES